VSGVRRLTTRYSKMQFGRIRNLFRQRKAERSVVFLNHSYYHFWYLAKALRKRGWDAITVSTDSPWSSHARYYHGEDVNLYLPSASNAARAVASKRIVRFVEKARNRFRLLHFAGDDHMSFFPWEIVNEDPPDMVEWRAAGRRIAYTVSGCNSATAQTSVAGWSAKTGAVDVCSRCVWQLRPDVCSDARNLAWGRKAARYCDLIFTEAIPALDFVRGGPRVVREPMTTALDPQIWQPSIRIPRRFRVRRDDQELLVYHGVGNFETRNSHGRNIKGTPAIVDALNRLKAEGMVVRLLFVTDMRSIDVRFIQAQSDIVIDQLNYGRYGAQAREGMMLGKPVVCYINPHELSPTDELQCLKEAPLVSATEQTIYEVLKDLAGDAAKRRAIGEASRRYAMKWHSADACAERYERIYDELMSREPQTGTYNSV